MTNQQLKAHCEDVIANPQDHLDWVVDMARVALSSLEAEPDVYVSTKTYSAPDLKTRVYRVEAKKDLTSGYTLYTAPPVPVMRPIELPAPLWCEGYSDLAMQNWCKNEGVKMAAEAIRAAGYEVKS